MTAISAEARPCLAQGVRLRVDHITGRKLLLRPEQGFELRGSAGDVVELCTSGLTVAAIIERLAAAHLDVARTQIEDDVGRLLGDLSRRGLIRFEVS